MSKLTEEVARFVKLGFMSFGGPAAHTAIMHDEAVKRLKWLTDEEFLDLLGATNLIPGPNSTEMAIHIGYLRAGWPGLIAGGLGFVLPATLIVLGLSWLYVRFGSTPKIEWLMYGIKPVVIAIIAQALWMLGRKAIKNHLTVFVGVAVFVLYFLRLNEIALLFAGGLVVMLIANWRRLRNPPSIPRRSGSGTGTQRSRPVAIPNQGGTYAQATSVGRPRIRPKLAHRRACLHQVLR